jgi:hypothetical protein
VLVGWQITPDAALIRKLCELKDVEIEEDVSDENIEDDMWEYLDDCGLTCYRDEELFGQELLHISDYGTEEIDLDDLARQIAEFQTTFADNLSLPSPCVYAGTRMC